MGLIGNDPNQVSLNGALGDLALPFKYSTLYSAYIQEALARDNQPVGE